MTKIVNRVSLPGKKELRGGSRVERFRSASSLPPMTLMGIYTLITLFRQRFMKYDSYYIPTDKAFLKKVLYLPFHFKKDLRYTILQGFKKTAQNI